MYNVVLVKYSEIALKGQNRKYFEKKLAENIKKALKKNKLKYERVKRFRSFIIVETRELEERIGSVLKNIFGIANFSFAYACEKDIEKIKKLVLKKSSFYKKAETFRVEASRQDKSFRHNSMEIGRIVGEIVYNKFRIKGDMKNPEAVVYVEIADRAYVYFKKTEGLGNLPVGSSGKVLCLLSGGIDSPAAAWLMMKRGCYVTYLHFYNNKKDIEKIKKLLETLNKCQLSSKLYLIPFANFQLNTADIFPKYEMILFRRYMLKIAEKIAEKEQAKAIVLGDNIAQVASQTLDNLQALEYHDCSNKNSYLHKLPIIRPLATYSKQEIIDLAKKIGTYEISVMPQKDCCSIISHHPSTKPNIEKILKLEQSLKIDKLVEKAVKNLEEIIVK